MRVTVGAVACALLFTAAPASARAYPHHHHVGRAVRAGATFGNAGAYERVKGIFKGELDPQDPRNRVIVNLDKAPRNDSGKVEYEADFSMLRPANPALGNHKLIYDVTNRGRKNLYRRFMDTKTRSDPRNAEDVVNASILRMGYTFAWSGWEPDAPRTDGGLAMKPVVATNGGAAIVRMIRDEFVSGTRNREEASDSRTGSSIKFVPSVV